MKEKTSVTLSPEILLGIDRIAGKNVSRSAFIEDVLRQYLSNRVKAERKARDLAILNRYAGELNRQAEEGLDDQAPEQD